MEDRMLQTPAPFDQPFAEAFPQPQPIDPDRPRWGPGAGIGAWAVSIVAPLVLGVLALIPVMMMEQRALGRMPTQEEMMKSPKVALASIIATIVGQVIAMLACWMIVTNMRKQPFFESLGWHWGGLSIARRIGLVVSIVLVMVGLQIGLPHVLPDSENTQFEQMLRTSATVRILIAAMAVLSAPIVEEIVYRGVLYSGLRSRIGVPVSVIVVTLLFTAVHVPQYWGAWASLVALTMLSLMLTVLRARSKSILLCIAVHFVFNCVGAVSILINKWD
ncbi:MAG: type II CAAX endopeptidase family protein [Acidobacteriota bacterium]